MTSREVPIGQAEAMESFPRQHARTRRFTLGAPRNLTVTADGGRVLFLRSPSGSDPTTALWCFDAETGDERVVADAAALLAGADEHLPAAERARRERARETAGGIVTYAVDAAGRVAVFPLSGRLFRVDLDSGAVDELAADAGVFDPRPAPSGGHVAYSSGGALRVTDGTVDRVLADDPDPDVTWGLAEFVAAEEMGRSRGFWWAPDGQSVAGARVDNRPVGIWHLADPTLPAQAPTAMRYPAAGTANAEVTLAVTDLDGAQHPIEWDRAAFPYLVDVHWAEGHPLLVAVQTRDQRRLQVLAVADVSAGAGRVLWEDTDEHWVEVVPGSLGWTAGGQLVTVADRDGVRRLLLDGEPVTPDGLQVRRVLSMGDSVLIAASHTDEPASTHVLRCTPRDSGGAELVALTSAPGIHGATAAGPVTVLVSASPERPGSTVTVLRNDEPVGTIASRAETPVITARPTFAVLGERRLQAAVLLPTGAEPGQRWPVLLDPYGGPGAARAVAAHDAHLTSQWFADQGFAVVVADGRGTPGRGSGWDREIHLDLATAPLQDQVDALHAAADLHPELDLSRVAIRGWSFGGYLAALAVLRRPDVFHAAIAGAPVTDWTLYDTHYTERYLGTPQEQPEAYRRSSLLADAAGLERPLLLIHGLADDNVVAAHSLQLSRALLEAGRPHTFLPLSGVSHMTPQEVVAENLLLLQVAFLRDALGSR